MTPKLQASVEEAVTSLRKELGANLYSVCLYGSAVRGNLVEGVSDLNLLIVIHQSSAEAHEGVARAVGWNPGIEPFVLGRRGFERSVRAFASKFSSIKRNYKVLHGADPLAGIKVDAELERFLCEQAVRNLRLRLVHAFVTRGKSKRYGWFILHQITPMFIQFSEVLRLSGGAIPQEFGERIPILEKELGLDGAVLRELLALKRTGRPVPEPEAQKWHEKLFPQVDAVLRAIESRWPDPGHGT